ncbi:MAG: cytochrome b5 domain-containing protein [bacterium]|nr:cytochrome b5 domain-containing protein [bacterium]
MRRPLGIMGVFVSAMVWSMAFGTEVYATETFANVTGQECRVCHIDPLGGGSLTEVGEGYLLSITPAGSAGNEEPHRAKSAPVLVKTVFRYLHIVTAFLWFGTILYVHIVLKPAYASKGLPPGEVRVGLASMVVMAATGSLLMYYKVPDSGLLLTSRFGILLLIKIVLFAVMVSTALFAVFVIGPKLKQRQPSTVFESREYTLTRLAGFDGEGGRPAFIAYKDKVYDVSESPLWKGGSHMKRHQAGDDLTLMLKQAPHGDEKILAMPEVGRLGQVSEKRPEQRYRGPFFILAYLNLALVFLILFVLAIWRE